MPETGHRYVIGERMRLLVVDDDPIQREFAKVYLSTPTAEVDVAADGVEALEMLRAGAHDMALIDLDMPVMDGFELLGRVRRDPALAGLPVIVITGRDDVASIDRAYDAGATSFVAKPVNWRILAYQVLFTLRACAGPRRAA